MIWPFSILLVLLGFFLLRFAMASTGQTRYTQILGGVLCFIAAFWAWHLFGWAPWFGLLAFFYWLFCPLQKLFSLDC